MPRRSNYKTKTPKQRPQYDSDQWETANSSSPFAITPIEGLSDTETTNTTPDAIKGRSRSSMSAQDKLERRRQRNREAAQRSRARKNNMLKYLEEKVHVLQQENGLLKLSLIKLQDGADVGGGGDDTGIVNLFEQAVMTPVRLGSGEYQMQHFPIVIERFPDHVETTDNLADVQQKILWMNSKLSPDIIGRTLINATIEGDSDGGNANNNDENNNNPVAHYDQFDPDTYHPFN